LSGSKESIQKRRELDNVLTIQSIAWLQ
jgi:hypothetical protein